MTDLRRIFPHLSDAHRQIIRGFIEEHDMALERHARRLEWGERVTPADGRAGTVVAAHGGRCVVATFAPDTPLVFVEARADEVRRNG